MDRIKALLSDPAFWIGSVFVSLVMNVLSSYLKEHTDKQWAKWSERQRELIRKERQEREDLVAEMAQNTDFLLKGLHYLLTLRFHQLFYAIFFCGMLLQLPNALYPSWLGFLVIGLLLTLMAKSFALNSNIQQRESELNEAFLRRVVNREPDKTPREK